MLSRELRTGLTLVAWLWFLGCVRVEVWQHVGLYDYGPQHLLLALTVWTSLVGVVTFGAVSVATLPLILRRLGFDPATCSAPFVATLVDVTGLVIYFSAATLIPTGTVL